MSCNAKKCHVLHVDTRNQKYYYEMNGVKLESVQCVKALGVSITSNLKFSQQCKDVAGKASRMLSFINRKFSFKNKDIILPLYISLIKSYLEYAVKFWSSHHTRDHSKIRSCPVKGYEHGYIPM